MYFATTDVMIAILLEGSLMECVCERDLFNSWNVEYGLELEF
jgi:hypothetical protein